MAAQKTIILDIPLDTKTLPELVQQAVTAIHQPDSAVVFACANPHSIVTAQRDPSFLAALQNADQLVADGVGVVAMARLARMPVGPRITGADYFFAILRAQPDVRGKRVFFFGSSERVLSLIRERFRREFPELVLAGTLSPPYGDWSSEENDRMIGVINDAKPDMLWVGMTAPKQEKWVHENRSRLKVPVIGSIGAVFDFFAGTYTRAPEWISRLGLEWAYRFYREPRRMWRRTVISAPVFVASFLWRHVCGVSKT